MTGTQRTLLCVAALFICASHAFAQQLGAIKDAIAVHIMLNRFADGRGDHPGGLVIAALFFGCVCWPH